MKRGISYLKEKFETNDKPDQDAFWDWMDSYWHKEEKIPVEQTYKTISANTTLDDSFHDCIVRITNNAIITIPNTLRNDFNCTFDVIGNSITGIFSAGSSVTISNPFGLVLANNSMATLYKVSNGNYRLNGGLTTI